MRLLIGWDRKATASVYASSYTRLALLMWAGGALSIGSKSSWGCETAAICGAPRREPTKTKAAPMTMPARRHPTDAPASVPCDTPSVWAGGGTIGACVVGTCVGATVGCDVGGIVGLTVGDGVGDGVGKGGCEAVQSALVSISYWLWWPVSPTVVYLRELYPCRRES